MRASRTHLESRKSLFFQHFPVFYRDVSVDGVQQVSQPVDQQLRALDAVHHDLQRPFASRDTAAGGPPTPQEVMEDAFAILESQRDPVNQQRLNGIRRTLSSADNAALVNRLQQFEHDNAQRNEGIRHAFHEMHEQSAAERGIVRRAVGSLFLGEQRGALRTINHNVGHIGHDEQWQLEQRQNYVTETDDTRLAAETTLEGLRNNPDVQWVFETANWRNLGRTPREIWTEMDRFTPPTPDFTTRAMRFEQYLVLTELLTPRQLALVRNGELNTNNPEHTQIMLLLLHLTEHSFRRFTAIGQHLAGMDEATAESIINDPTKNPTARPMPGTPEEKRVLAIELEYFDAAGNVDFKKAFPRGERGGIFYKLAKGKGGLPVETARDVVETELKRVAEIKFKLGDVLSTDEEAALSPKERGKVADLIDQATGAPYVPVRRGNPDGVGLKLSNADPNAITDRIEDLEAAKRAFDTAASKQAELNQIDTPAVLNRALSRVRGDIAALPTGAAATPTTAAERAALQQELTTLQQQALRRRTLGAEIATAWSEMQRLAVPAVVPVVAAIPALPAGAPFDPNFGNQIQHALRTASREQTRATNAANDTNRTTHDQLRIELETAEDALTTARQKLTAAQTERVHRAPEAGMTAEEILLVIFKEQEMYDAERGGRNETAAQAELTAKLKLRRMEAAAYNQRALHDQLELAENLGNAREVEQGKRVGRMAKGALKDALIYGGASMAVATPLALLVGAGAAARGAYREYAEYNAERMLGGQEVLQKFFGGETGEATHGHDAHGHDNDNHAHEHHDTTKYDRVVECSHSLVRFQRLVQNGEVSTKELAGLHMLTEEALKTGRLPPADVALYTRLRRFAWITLVQQCDGVRPATEFIEKNGTKGLYEKLAKRPKQTNFVGRVWGNWREQSKKNLKKAEGGLYTLPGDTFGILKGAMVAALPFGIGKAANSNHGGGHAAAAH